MSTAPTTERPPVPNFAPTPKARYRMSGTRISEHRALLELPAFEKAIDAALAEYEAQIAQNTTQNPNLAATNGFKSAGVHEFLYTLRTLSEQSKIIRTIPNDNLTHGV